MPDYFPTLIEFHDYLKTLPFEERHAILVHAASRMQIMRSSFGEALTDRVEKEAWIAQLPPGEQAKVQAEREKYQATWKAEMQNRARRSARSPQRTPLPPCPEEKP